LIKRNIYNYIYKADKVRDFFSAIQMFIKQKKGLKIKF